MVSGKSETPFLMSATVMKKATQNTALPKMKLILSPKGLFKKTEKYYFVIVAVCNTVTLFHYTGTEKKESDGKGRNGKKEQPKLLLLPLRQKPVAFRYWSR